MVVVGGLYMAPRTDIRFTAQKACSSYVHEEQYEKLFPRLQKHNTYAAIPDGCVRTTSGCARSRCLRGRYRPLRRPYSLIPREIGPWNHKQAKNMIYVRRT